MKNQTVIRQENYEHILRNFIGPLFGDEEVLSGKTPHDIYLTGALYPPSMRRNGADENDSDPEDFEVVDGEGHKNTSEEDLASAKDVPEEKVLFPSSAGFSFRVKNDVKSVKIKIGCGTYFQNTIDGKPALQRKPFLDERVLDIQSDDKIWLQQDWMQLTVKVRPQGSSKVVTVIVVNRAKVEKFIPQGRNSRLFRNIGTLWQLEISVSEISEGDFLKVEPEPRITSSNEVNASFLLYRKHTPFAFGHSCSVDWEKLGKLVKIESKFIPKFPLRMMVAAQIPGTDLNIKNFCTEKALLERGIPSLFSLVRSYEDWIRSLELEAKSFSNPELKAIALHMIADCKNANRRIQKGIDLIKNDPKVALCVSIANEAMQNQFNVKNVEGREFVWHPFQMAFFLLNLEGLVDRKSPERMIADLLWFPTGGGKTEAYLLISAFTILWRRTCASGSEGGAGVTIILRYTLRLLTQQQLQRSARMICALDKIRREKYSELLGDTEVSIGLWVGNDSFPNTPEDWESKRQKGTVPIPFENCPSCDSVLRISNYHLRSIKVGKSSFKRLEISCDQDGTCAYHRRPLPIHLIDEDVYRFNPTLIIGTVDKFANFAWKSDAGKLLNRFEMRCSVHGVYFDDEAFCGCAKPVVTLPPELIIQDELHLISGPLGSMVGAFESAIRFICRSDGVEPKYITSTATIRGAERQLSELYSRQAFQFPPSGLDGDNNFFSVSVAADKSEKIREYIGINAQGRSPKLVMARLYGLLNHVYQDMRTDPGVNLKALDGFRTVVGYFNARKELGGVKTMLGDDVPKWRKFHHGQDGSSYDENLPLDYTELMGAVDSKLLMGELERTAKDGHTAPEFVLATNILSVGIDINRLALMVIAGQPKTSSEYIQASSRVGRNGPGLVIVPFNWSRARDRSHFEKFRSFHEQLYRFVEGISVTPYSPEARRRTLAGTFVAVARHTIKQLRNDEDAIKFEAFPNSLDAFANYYLSSITDPDERDDAENEIKSFLKIWIQYSQNKATPLTYRCTESRRGVLGVLGQDKVNSVDVFVTSLRNVDEEVPAVLTRRPHVTA